MVADEIARTVWPYVEGGRLSPSSTRVFPLEQAAEAHRQMEAGEHIGKIVLEVCPPRFERKLREAQTGSPPASPAAFCSGKLLSWIISLADLHLIRSCRCTDSRK